MTSVVRVLAGWLLLAVPATALATVLVGRRPHCVRSAVRLGIIAALPGLVALLWLESHHGTRSVTRVAVLLSALVPGYALAGWLALRGDHPASITTGQAAGEREIEHADASATRDVA